MPGIPAIIEDMSMPPISATHPGHQRGGGKRATRGALSPRTHAQTLQVRLVHTHGCARGRIINIIYTYRPCLPCLRRPSFASGPCHQAFPGSPTYPCPAQRAHMPRDLREMKGRTSLTNPGSRLKPSALTSSSLSSSSSFHLSQSTLRVAIFAPVPPNKSHAHARERHENTTSARERHCQK